MALKVGVKCKSRLNSNRNLSWFFREGVLPYLIVMFWFNFGTLVHLILFKTRCQLYSAIIVQSGDLPLLFCCFFCFLFLVNVSFYLKKPNLSETSVHVSVVVPHDTGGIFPRAVTAPSGGWTWRITCIWFGSSCYLWNMNGTTFTILDAIASLEPGLVAHSLSHSRIEIRSLAYLIIQN